MRIDKDNTSDKLNIMTGPYTKKNNKSNKMSKNIQHLHNHINYANFEAVPEYYRNMNTSEFKIAMKMK